MAAPAPAFPVTVVYCPNCSMPPEFCSYSGSKFEKCKPWLRDNFPELYPELFSPSAAAPAPPASEAAGVGGSASSVGAATAAMSALSVDGAGVPIGGDGGASSASKAPPRAWAVHWLLLLPLHRTVLYPSAPGPQQLQQPQPRLERAAARRRPTRRPSSSPSRTAAAASSSRAYRASRPSTSSSRKPRPVRAAPPPPRAPPPPATTARPLSPPPPCSAWQEVRLGRDRLQDADGGAGDRHPGRPLRGAARHARLALRRPRGGDRRAGLTLPHMARRTGGLPLALAVRGVLE